MPFIITPKVDHLYPLPEGVDAMTLVSGEFDTLAVAQTVAEAALNSFPGVPRVISEIKVRLSASVAVTVIAEVSTAQAPAGLVSRSAPQSPAADAK